MLVTKQHMSGGVPSYRVTVEYYEAPKMVYNVATNHIEHLRRSMINDDVKRLVVEPVMITVKEADNGQDD